MKSHTALDFLLYSCFGITTESSKEDIIHSAIDRAYRDAASHVLSLKEECKNNPGDNPKSKAIEAIKNFVDDFSKINDTNSYNSQHENLCGRLIEIYDDTTNEGHNFTVGVAQKWINMTMKYLCVIASVLKLCNNDERGSKEYCDYFDNEISEHEEFLHIPIDSFILEFISRSDKKKDKFLGEWQIKIPMKEKCKVETGYFSDNSLPWSKYEDYDQYNGLQNSVKENIPKNESLFDWENNAWIEVSKARKEKNKK